MNRLTRDGTAKPVSRDKILRCERGHEKFAFPVQLTTCRIDYLARLIQTLLIVMTIHSYIHTIQGHFRGAKKREQVGFGGNTVMSYRFFSG